MSTPSPFAVAADAYPGGLAALVEPLQVASVQVLSNWKTRGVPADKCKAVEKLLGVSVKELRPADWQKFWPEPALDAA